MGDQQRILAVVRFAYLLLFPATTYRYLNESNRFDAYTTRPRASFALGTRSCLFLDPFTDVGDRLSQQVLTPILPISLRGLPIEPNSPDPISW